MIFSDKLFGNFLNAETITTARFLNFSQDALNKLINANGGGSYTALITSLTPQVAALAAELGGVDTGINLQKGATLTNDQVLANFAKTMSDEEPFIARALGGSGTPAYLEFYPHRLTEYTKAAKTDMHTLTQRVNAAATNHAAELGPALTATLQAFENDWAKSRNVQQQQKGWVNDNRSSRSAALTALQSGMLTAVHTIAALYPGDVQQCSALFNFTLLFTQTHHKHESYKGAPAAGETLVVINRTLTDSVQLTIRNTSGNAPLAVWLGSDGTSPMPADALTVQPESSASPKPHKLGDLKSTFLLFANTSAVNAGSYEVELVGSEKG
jgi:hypothetical protein